MPNFVVDDGRWSLFFTWRRYHRMNRRIKTHIHTTHTHTLKQRRYRIPRDDTNASHRTGVRCRILYWVFSEFASTLLNQTSMPDLRRRFWHSTDFDRLLPTSTIGISTRFYLLVIAGQRCLVVVGASSSQCGQTVALGDGGIALAIALVIQLPLIVVHLIDLALHSTRRPVVNKRARTHTHIHVRTETHADSHTHAHTHTRTHTQTHTHTRSDSHQVANKYTDTDFRPDPPPSLGDPCPVAGTTWATPGSRCCLFFSTDITSDAFKSDLLLG